MSTHISRAREKGILFEYAAPEKKSSKAIILLAGMPGVPSKKDCILFFAKKGFWVFFPRYRGTWESDGEFLAQPLENDVFDMMTIAQTGFFDAWSGEKVEPGVKSFYLFGNSTGGAAALCAAHDVRVKKAVVFAPVIDWRIDSESEPIEQVYAFTRVGFGEGYRFSDKNWKKLIDGKITNPNTTAYAIPKEKILIVAPLDDEVVPALITKAFAKELGIQAFFPKTGGHMGTSDAILPKTFKLYKKHLGL